MAKMPDATALGRGPQQQATTAFNVPVQQAVPTGAIEAQGLSKLGSSLFDAGIRIKDRQDKLKESKARSLFMQSHIETVNSFEGDQDYETYGKRYTEKMDEAKKKAADLIKSPSRRQLFLDDADLQVQRGIGEMARISWSKEKEYGRADLQDIIDSNRKYALLAKDEQSRIDLIDSTNSAINAAKENGYIDPDTAQSLQQKTTQDYVSSIISVQPPDAQIQILSDKKGIAGLLHEDDRVSLLDKAGAQKITELRNNEWLNQLARENLFNDLSLKVESVGIHQITPKEWGSLDKGQRESLSKYAKDLAEGNNIPTDWNVYYQLKGQASDPVTQKTFERSDLTQYRNRLGTDEYKQLIGLQGKIREGKKDPALDEFRTEKQIVDGTLREIGLKPTPKEGSQDATDVNLFRKMVAERKQILQSQTGKKATESEMQAIVDDLVIKGQVPGTGWWNTNFMADEKRSFELKPGESLVDDGKVVFETDVGKVPKQDRDEIEAALTELGRPVNEETILSWYNRSLRVYDQ